MWEGSGVGRSAGSGFPAEPAWGLGRRHQEAGAYRGAGRRCRRQGRRASFQLSREQGISAGPQDLKPAGFKPARFC